MEQAIGPIHADLVKSAMTYPTYRSLIDSLLAQNKTTGHNHSEAYLDYTRMNVQRMSRWDKTAKARQSEMEWRPEAFVSTNHPSAACRESPTRE